VIKPKDEILHYVQNDKKCMFVILEEHFGYAQHRLRDEESRGCAKFSYEGGNSSRLYK